MRRINRTRRALLATICTALAAALIGCGTSTPHTDTGATDARDGQAPIRVAYGDAPDTYGLLHLPEGSGPHPVVVMVHGGGWLEEHDLSYFEPLSRSLVDDGVAVWSIEYRRVDGAGGWPLTLADADDATEALGTVVQDASGNTLDLDRVHLAGHSAGGHLAAWIAGRHTLPPDSPGHQPTIRPRSATIMAGVLDLSLAATDGHDVFVRNLLGGMPDEQPERYRIASPIEHLPVRLPVTALHGSADQTVDPAQSLRYVTAATAAGDPAVLRTLEGVGHGDFGNVTSSAWAAAKAVILDHVHARGAE
ncbi:alpha/beta hydrolase family protein [Rhodococcus zopfii]|uniref:alpha/beta hydrolase family protein n=1 Tax=Rhodococcus zopfii TaxID=43772 RepID=UPI001EDD8B36|nr:prolyl oligopeptidase family serine peptidase [Rhodococcus zopfii]